MRMIMKGDTVDVVAVWREGPNSNVSRTMKTLFVSIHDSQEAAKILRKHSLLLHNMGCFHFRTCFINPYFPH